MLSKPKRRLSARARRIVAITAGLAMAVSAVAVPTFTANAAEKPPTWRASTGYGKLPTAPQPDKKYAIPLKDLPPNAQKATRGPSAPGKRAHAFEKVSGLGRVVGGVEVNSSEYPGVVGVVTYFFAEDGEYYYTTCTGSVLSPTRVLTAAHCSVYLGGYGHTEVIAGRNNLFTDTAGFVARVGAAWTHQDYNHEAQWNDPTIPPVDDVTVLNLKDTLPAVYAPVTLANQGAADPAGGTAAKIVGYGITGGEEDDSGILRAGDVKIAADATCGSDDQWGSDFDPQRMMCAGGEGVDTCSGDSGGPIFTGAATSRVQVGITDWGSRDCRSLLGVYEALNHYSNIIKQQIPLVPANNLDWAGDGHSDLFARDKSNGDLIHYSGAGLANGTLSGISYGDLFGEGWNYYNKVFRVNNWNGDGNPSIFAQDSAGTLFQYKGDGYGGITDDSPRQIGVGFKFTDIMVTNNWTGNGMPNLIGRTTGGKLVLYTSNGSGGWSNPNGTVIGAGWNGFNTILTPGSWLGDGRQSLIGRTPAGDLRLYTSKGAGGGWVNSAGDLIGKGWAGFTTFMSPGDWNGDNLVDILGVVKSNGDLKMYNTNGKGKWLDAKGRVISVGWDEFNAIF